MAGETFYTYLGGPRTFWGNSGPNIRINNNFGFPCSPPFMMGGCGCGYNNIRMNSPFSIMAMVNNMMGQTLPYWKFNYAGNSGASSGNETSSSLDKLTSARQALNNLGFTNAEGYGLYLDESNNVIYSYTKDGKECTASTLPELISKISSGKTEGAGSSNSEKELSTDSTIVASDTSASSETDKASKSSEVSEADTTATDETDETSAVDSSHTSGNKVNKRKYSRGDVGKGFEWTTYNQLSDAALKQKINGCSTTIDLMKVLFPSSYFAGKSDAEIKGSKYYKVLKNANPSAIDNDGNIVNKEKLDIIIKKGSNVQAANGRNSAHTIKANNGFSIERKADGSYAYTKNGRSVSMQEYAKACPQTFINEHNKRWTFDTLKTALEIYNTTKLSKYRTSGQKHFSSINGYTQGQPPTVYITVGYKGNGITNNWSYTMKYQNAQNGIINKDIAQIYEDLHNGYDKMGD